MHWRFRRREQERLGFDTPAIIAGPSPGSSENRPSCHDFSPVVPPSGTRFPDPRERRSLPRAEPLFTLKSDFVKSYYDLCVNSRVRREKIAGLFRPFATE